MALNNPPSGYFNSGEFTASSLPWVVSGTTSGTSVTKYTFPKVTKNIIVHNLETTSKKLRIGFTLNGINGVGDNFFFVIDKGEFFTCDSRVTELYLRSDTTNTISFSVYAGLTTIAAGQMPTLTGSLGDGTPGWTGVG